ncbi:MAG: helix-turn-helix domain-containing protein [Eubacteriales bacterium]|nr:helix-turn-helix domain-containing protein [Eubacteriales bacterium]
MKPEEFQALLQGAVAGDRDALEEIFEMYMPLINHASTINGELDENCRQYMMHIALNTGKITV